MGTNEKASDETDAIDHGTDTTLVAIILLLTMAMAMTMLMAMTVAIIEVADSNDGVNSGLRGHSNERPSISEQLPPPQNIDTA